MADWTTNDESEAAFANYETDSEEDDVQIARKERIAAARAAARSYSAKIEEPQWFLDPVASQSEKATSRPALFRLHELYLRRQFALVLEGALVLWREVREAAVREGGAEETELVDLVMRSSLKAKDVHVSDEVLSVARRWQVLGRSHPTLCHTASLLLSSVERSRLSSPLEPMLPLFSSLTIHPSLPPYLDQLHALLLRFESYPALAESCVGSLDRSSEASARRKDELERLVEAGAGEEARKAFERVWNRGAKEDEEEREAMGRDVRSL